MAGVARLQRSGVGRRTLAVRDNASAAASFGVSPKVAKLTAFAFAGALAGLAGALLAGLQVSTTVVPVSGAGGFDAELSLQVVAMVVIGGLGSVPGAVLGAIYVVGLPDLFPGNNTVALLSSGIGLLVLLLYFPGGLVQLTDPLRHALVRVASRRVPLVQGNSAGAVIAPPPRPTRPDARPGAERPAPVAALSVELVSVHFGGRTALDEVGIEVGQGEIVGLIGANGRASRR